MNWVIICAVIATLLVNAPFVYILVRVHNAALVSRLIGYAPNQFLFPLLAFPVAAFATFVAMKLLITTLQQTHPAHPVIRWTVDNWIVIALIGVILSASVCIVDYFFSVKTFDKLETPYAQQAVTATEEARKMILAFPKDTRDENRKTLIQQWRDEKATVIPRLSQTNDLRKDLLALNPGVYLQIVQDPKLQREFHLMNPSVQALNVLQLFTSLLVAVCSLFVTVLGIYVFKSDPSVAQLPILKKALSAVFFAVTFYSIFPILYAQQRAEIEYVVGSGYTMMPHVFSGIIIVIILLALATLEPLKGNISDLVTARIIPILLVAAGFGFNLLDSQPLRQMVGVEANWGTRIMLMICCLIVWVLVIFHLWPWTKDQASSASMPTPKQTGKP